MQDSNKKGMSGKIEFQSQKLITEERQKRRQKLIDNTHEKVKNILSGEIEIGEK